ncbi:MAG: manganese efflux pump [Elusimicrobiaceae bacterium]|nr:manganese efflux pump [Elusimicrobiaceae bacterium]
MSLLSAILIALSLSMDNLAVTVSAGCAAHSRIPLKREMLASFGFMLAHLVMFSCGWFLGKGVGHYVDAIDHWVAFGILAWIGIHMIWESGHHKEEEQDFSKRIFGGALFWLAFATSVDAWLVGMGLSLVHAPFVLTATTMAISVFFTSWLGFYFGAWLGRKFGQQMEMLGGIALILLGLKLLLEGLGIW